MIIVSTYIITDGVFKVINESLEMIVDRSSIIAQTNSRVGFSDLSKRF